MMNGGSYMKRRLTLLPTGGGVKGKERAGRATEEVSRPARGVNQRFDVFDLALDGVRVCVGALAAATAVIVNDCKIPSQQLGQLGGGIAISQGSADEDNRRPRDRPLKGYGCSVRGLDRCLYSVHAICVRRPVDSHCKDHEGDHACKHEASASKKATRRSRFAHASPAKSSASLS